MIVGPVLWYDADGWEIKTPTVRQSGCHWDMCVLMNVYGNKKM